MQMLCFYCPHPDGVSNLVYDFLLVLLIGLIFKLSACSFKLCLEFKHIVDILVKMQDLNTMIKKFVAKLQKE